MFKALLQVYLDVFRIFISLLLKQIFLHLSLLSTRSEFWMHCKHKDFSQQLTCYYHYIILASPTPHFDYLHCNHLSTMEYVSFFHDDFKQMLPSF